MTLLKNQLVNLFDKYTLVIPPRLKCHQDGIPGRRVLFIDDKKGTISVSFEENMKLMDMDENPGKKAYVFDSFSAGPEMAMMAEKIAEYAAAGCDFDTVVEKVEAYQNRVHTLFSLESLTNLARNGRVNPAVARIAGVLGIRVIGDANHGQITPIHKVRGHKKAMQTLVEMMEERGFYDGALIRVAACFAQSQAEDLKALVLAKWPNARFVIEHTTDSYYQIVRQLILSQWPQGQVTVIPTTGLCSFYAEVGGLMIGLEGSFNENNHTGLFK